MIKLRSPRWIACALALGTLAPSARAEGVRVDYAAPPTCPPKEALLSALNRRGTTVETTTSRSLEIDIRATDRGFRGTLQVRDGATVSQPREIEGDTCEEVVEGLAVTAAIALERAPAETSSTTPAEAEPPPAEAPAPPADTAPKQVPPAKPAGKPRRLETKGQFGPDSVPVRAGQLTIDYELALSLSGGFIYGLLPETLVPRYELTLQRANFVTVPDNTNSYLIGGILGARWTLFGPVTHEVDGFSTRLWGLKAGVSGCSQLTYDMDGAVVLMCGEIAAGAIDLRTEDEDGTVTQDETFGVGTAALFLNARYNIGPHFHLGMTVGGEIWTSEIVGRRADGSEIFHSSLLTAHALAGFGLHF